MFVSGLTGSGKSYYIANLLKHNKPKFIFIMSPVKDDPAFKSLKPTPIHLDILSYEQEFDKPFEIEDLPPESVVILDDIAYMTVSRNDSKPIIIKIATDKLNKFFY